MTEVEALSAAGRFAVDDVSTQSKRAIIEVANGKGQAMGKQRTRRQHCLTAQIGGFIVSFDGHVDVTPIAQRGEHAPAQRTVGSPGAG
jgi:hypothetical protein